MPESEPPRLPQVPPHEARRQAEDCLGEGDGGVLRALAWGVVAVAGELAELRRERRSRR